MKLIYRHVAVYIFLFLSGLIRADEYYPKNPSVRFLGTDQGNVGDCAAEAQVTALETAFANHGYHVLFSLFYTHAKNYKDKADSGKNVMLNINEADKNIIARAGEMIPNYMWPEDASGYSPSLTGIRPHPSEAIIWDDDMPNSNAFGLTHRFLSFEPNFANSVRDISGLKSSVSSGDAVTLGVHGMFMGSQGVADKWNQKTGLLISKYSWNKLVEEINKAKSNTGGTGKEEGVNYLNHGVAIVGFDDTLYGDQGYAVPGGFIVRNSWNDSAAQGAISKTMSPSEISDFKKMRAKLSPINLPGYYAVPYQYVIDMVNNNMGGYQVWTINYGAYAEKYNELRRRYAIFNTPYACDSMNKLVSRSTVAKYKVGNYRRQLEIVRNSNRSKDDIALATLDLYKMALAEMTNRQKIGSGARFSYAKMAKHLTKNIDNVSAFYSGKFNEYYCPINDNGTTKTGRVWPYLSHFQQPEFQVSLDELASSPHRLIGWEMFLRALVKIKADSDLN